MLPLLFSKQIYATNLESYLLNPPQRISVQEGKIGISYEEATQLLNFIKPNLSQKTLHVKAKKIPSILFDVSIDSIHFKKQAYQLEISKNKITIQGGNSAGIFYGKQTLLQLLKYSLLEKKNLPHLTILDWPDFERRGYMLDISRNKIPTMKSLYELVNILAKLKINELQLYTEHTFAYKKHKRVWKGSSPMTSRQIKSLKNYCRKYFIDLVPNQNSFGHMENWLKHEKYMPLASCPTKCKRTSCLDPLNSKSLELIQELYSELLPNFSSPYFNIGGDETFELCKEKNLSLCKKIGKPQVYLNYLKQLNTEANKYGKQAQFWADMILKYPQIINETPKNMIAMVWGYESNYPFEENLNKLKPTGIDTYVCPGTSSWRSIIGKNHHAFINLKQAAQNGKKLKAKGFLNTNWGDEGHLQPATVVYPSLIIGASYSWNHTENALSNLEFHLNQYFFQDLSGNLSKAILKLGNAYLKTKTPQGNANIFHLLLTKYDRPFNEQYQTKKLTIKGLEAAKKDVLEAIFLLKNAESKAENTKISIKEMEQAAKLALHTLNLGIARLNSPDQSIKKIPFEIKQALIMELQYLIKNHKKLWIKRNRIGGLKESSSWLKKLLTYYKN